MSPPLSGNLLQRSTCRPGLHPHPTCQMALTCSESCSSAPEKRRRRREARWLTFSSLLLSYNGVLDKLPNSYFILLFITLLYNLNQALAHTDINYAQRKGVKLMTAYSNTKCDMKHKLLKQTALTFTLKGKRGSKEAKTKEGKKRRKGRK